MNGDRNIIYISKPHITKQNNKYRLCALIIDGDNSKELYYEVDLKYGAYLVYERSDCFVLGLLNTAMNEEKDIVCEAPVTESLLFQLKQYYIPILSQNMHDLYYIEIQADAITDHIDSQNLSVTGNSGGVDAFFSILKYSDTGFANHNVSHLIFNNISTADDNEERIKQLYDRDNQEKSKIAQELGLESLSVYTNLFEFYKSKHIFNFYFAAQYISVGYALAKLIRYYYFSSGVSVKDFSFDERKIKDGAYFDTFVLDCLSTELIKVYSAGGEIDRLSKTKYISDHPVVKRHLQVCAIEQFSEYYNYANFNYKDKLNCGKCGKCVRTISSLYALNKLDGYDNIFDLTTFYKNKNSFIGRELASDSKEFARDIKRELIKSNKFSILVYPWFVFWKIENFLREKLRNNNLLRSLYFSYKKKRVDK